MVRDGLYSVRGNQSDWRGDVTEVGSIVWVMLGMNRRVENDVGERRDVLCSVGDDGSDWRGV